MSSTNYSFFEDVRAVVCLIPLGKVTTYGAIAHYLGAKGSARMVGWALNKSDPSVPAHRVVNRMGLLTGKQHFESHQTMQERLEAENIPIKDNQIQNLNHYFWDPILELS